MIPSTHLVCRPCPAPQIQIPAATPRPTFVRQIAIDGSPAATYLAGRTYRPLYLVAVGVLEQPIPPPDGYERSSNDVGCQARRSPQRTMCSESGDPARDRLLEGHWPSTLSCQCAQNERVDRIGAHRRRTCMHGVIGTFGACGTSESCQVLSGQL